MADTTNNTPPTPVTPNPVPSSPPAAAPPQQPPKASRKITDLLPKNKMVLFLGLGAVVTVILIIAILLVLKGKSPRSNDGNTITDGGPKVSVTPIAVPGKAAYVKGSEIWVSNITDPQPQKMGAVPILANPDEEISITRMSWSTDGRLVGFLLTRPSGDRTALKVMKNGDGSLLDVFATGEAGPIYDFTWIPNSLEVIVSYAYSDSLIGKKYFLGKLSVLGFPGTERFLDWPKPIIQVRISQSGFIYFLDQGQDLWRVALSGGRYYPVLRGVASFDLSPDGTKLAYERGIDGEIWTSNENGGNSKQITFTSDERKEIYGKGGRSNPLWSPDNQTILFTETGTTYVGVGIVKGDGSGLRSVESNTISPKIKYNDFFDRRITYPQWIDAKQILFLGETDTPEITNNVYVLSISDGGFQPLIEDASVPSWSRL